MNETRVSEMLLERREGERLAFVPLPIDARIIASHVCAMLNGNGGTVLVGADKDGRVKHGFSEADADELGRFLHSSVVPRALFTVSLDPTPNGPVICVDIPAGRDRPYVFDGSIYVRVGTRTQRADTEAMRAMIEERAAEPERWERRPSLGLETDELDREIVNETVRRAMDRRGYRFRNANSIRDVLADLGLSRNGQLTNAADVLFGAKVAIRHPQIRMRAVRYESDKGGDYADDQLYEGPAFDLLRDGLAFMRRHVSIAAEFPPGSLRRESRPQYPFSALREGLVNALVHRDYAAFSGSIALSIYPGRVEIWNSGRIPEGIDVRDLPRETHPSVLVNPDISHVFYLHELMERVGRGTFKIVQECRALGLRTPQWKQEPGGVRLTFFAATARPRAAARLNERQRRVLQALRSGQAIRPRDYLERFGAQVTERQARRDLVGLEAGGYLRRVRTGPASAFERTEKEAEL